MIRSWLKRLRNLLRSASRPSAEQSDQENAVDIKDHNCTVADLNRDAARHDAKIGKGYARDKTKKERLAELKQGTVPRPPHKPWTGDYTDWTADPFTDLNWRFQFHTLRWINPYLWDALDGNEESKAEWKRIVRSWAEANIPPHRAADKYAWMDMTDGNRAIQISLGAPLMNTEDHWYVDVLAVHRNWLLDDTRIVPGNHGFHQNLGLFVVSAVLSDETGIQRAIERLGAQVLVAFDDQGLNEEGSVAYHQSNMVWWRQARKRLRLEGYDFSPEAVERLDKAGEAMAHLLLPDGTMPQVGDGGRGRGRRGLHPLLDQVVKGRVRDTGLPLFKHFTNGFTVSRSGWGETRPFNRESHTIVRHGADLQRHSHNDRGSVHLYTLGRRWITDGGFHSYQRRSRHRNYTRSRSAHSLVNLPAQEYDITGDVPVQLLQNQDELHAIEVVDRNFESAQWHRRVIFLRQLDVWVVWDRIEADQPEHIQQQWLIDIGIDVSIEHDSSVTLTASEDQLHMQWFGDLPTLDVAKGDRSSKSKRGLIGIGWKRMRNGTSIHAEFHEQSVDSIVVISHSDTTLLEAQLVAREPMHSFSLELIHTDGQYRLDVTPETSLLTRFQA